MLKCFLFNGSDTESIFGIRRSNRYDRTIITALLAPPATKKENALNFINIPELYIQRQTGPFNGDLPKFGKENDYPSCAVIMSKNLTDCLTEDELNDAIHFWTSSEDEIPSKRQRIYNYFYMDGVR